MFITDPIAMLASNDQDLVFVLGDPELEQGNGHGLWQQGEGQGFRVKDFHCVRAQGVCSPSQDNDLESKENECILLDFWPFKMEGWKVSALKDFSELSHLYDFLNCKTYFK